MARSGFKRLIFEVVALQTLKLAVSFDLPRSFPALRSCPALARSISVHAKRGGSQMPRGVKKENLPSKVCVVCNRPFTWRKKWERCWDEVTTCSKSCNGARKVLKEAAAAPSELVDPDAGADAVDVRQQRKAATKAAKALTRAKREGSAPAEAGQKSCDQCGKGVNLLVRCQVDASQAWRMVCGKCWKGVSGGQVDGDASHPHYRYGGLWKNRVQRGGESQQVAKSASAEDMEVSILGDEVSSDEGGR